VRTLGTTVALVSSRGGVFGVRVNGEVIFSRQQRRRSPKSTELKWLVQDHMSPGKALGHSDHR
jgi:selenoprotein W-related protein